MMHYDLQFFRDFLVDIDSTYLSERKTAKWTEIGLEMKRFEWLKSLVDAHHLYNVSQKRVPP